MRPRQRSSPPRNSHFCFETGRRASCSPGGTPRRVPLDPSPPAPSFRRRRPACSGSRLPAPSPVATVAARALLRHARAVLPFAIFLCRTTRHANRSRGRRENPWRATGKRRLPMPLPRRDSREGQGRRSPLFDRRRWRPRAALYLSCRMRPARHSRRDRQAGLARRASLRVRRKIHLPGAQRQKPPARTPSPFGAARRPSPALPPKPIFASAASTSRRPPRSGFCLAIAMSRAENISLA